jgi:hypothetical protein
MSKAEDPSQSHPMLGKLEPLGWAELGQKEPAVKVTNTSREQQDPTPP